MYLHQRKVLCSAVENIIVSYSVTKQLNDAVTELETAIQRIVKQNKTFPRAYSSIDGLLKQYIYWLNTGFTKASSVEFDGTKLKSTAHNLINEYHSHAITLSSEPYKEPVLNALFKALANKDYETAQKSLDSLDAEFEKKKKSISFAYIWLPPIATIIGAIITAVLTAVLQ